MIGPGPAFVILTGFLGSGKTTLLREFLTSPEAADTAVIVNEAGEIGLDGIILRESSNVPISMLANGCICCEAGNDLVATVVELMQAERPNATGSLRRIILETSGLSKPGPTLRQLAGLAQFRMPVSVLATFDAIRGKQASEYDEALSQWTAAHRIVVTKVDAVSSAQLEGIRGEIAGMNPLAEVVATVDRAASVAAAFAPLTRSAPMPDIRTSCSGSAHARISLHLARAQGPLRHHDLSMWLDNLAGALGDRLLRVKGLVRVAECDRPLLVQSVGTLYSPLVPFGVADAQASDFLVVISRDTGSDALEAVTPAKIFQISSR